MMKFCSPVARTIFATALSAITLGIASTAHAENHALIMWIGDYGDRKLDLPGIDLDAANAKKIALAMGVTEKNIRTIDNREFTRQQIEKEFSGLVSRINPGDKVFIYYSGHGAQLEGIKGVSSGKCAEVMVARGPEWYADFELERKLNDLGKKASQVIMMNDSCFSGGTATKSMQNSENFVSKSYPGEFKDAVKVSDSHTCGNAVNKSSRNLTIVGEQYGTNVLYIAAAADNEVAGASDMGSLATNAWLECLTSSAADTNRSGSVDGEELRNCSQQRMQRRQTITIVGDGRLPVSFVSLQSAGGRHNASSDTGNRVNAARTLEDIRASSSRSIKVTLQPASTNLRIGRDFLNFTVSSDRAGYLYLLHVDSDGKTFNLLFPNKLDQNNRITAGAHRFPRQNWRVQAGGPAGTSHIMAILSPEPRNFTKDMNDNETFPELQADEEASKTLQVIASGANQGNSGSYGASAVIAVREVQ